MVAYDFDTRILLKNVGMPVIFPSNGATLKKSICVMKNFIFSTNTKQLILRLTPVCYHLLDWMIEVLKNKTYWKFNN